MLRLATRERRVMLLHCLENRLCVWRPDTLTDLSYNIVLIEGHPSWSGWARHAYGHLLFTTIEERTYHTVKVPLSQPCFDHFFGPCFRGHDEAGLLAFEALQGLPRPARGTRTKRGSRGLESVLWATFGPAS